MLTFKRERQGHFYKVVSMFVAFAFLTNFIIPAPGFAQTLSLLPTPGSMVHLSLGYNPALLTGIQIHPENPLEFDFIVNDGDDNLSGDELTGEAEKMIKYFLASLTAPEKDLWVNLSPYEENRIIPGSLAQTDIGRDLLAQDYILKQITASLIYPEDDLGKKFWDKVYKKAYEVYGTTEIPIDTFNKVWIMPDRVSVYEQGNMVFVAEASLKVMLEEDYVALQSSDESLKNIKGTTENKLASDIVREIVLPELEKEVNQGKNFASLRQVYHSLILAVWFKKALNQSLLGQIYVDQNKFKGLGLDEEGIKEKIYQQYLEAYKKGAYNYIKPEYDQHSKRNIPRKYFSGGIQIAAEVSSRLELISSPTKIHQKNIIKDGDNTMFTAALVGSASPVVRITKADGTVKVVDFGQGVGIGAANRETLDLLRKMKRGISASARGLGEGSNQKRFQTNREPDSTIRGFFGNAQYFYYYGPSNVAGALESGVNRDIRIYNRRTLKPINISKAKEIINSSKGCALHIIKGNEKIAFLSSSGIALREGDKIKGSLTAAFERIDQAYPGVLPERVYLEFSDGEKDEIPMQGIFNLIDAVEDIPVDEDIDVVEVFLSDARVVRIAFDQNAPEETWIVKRAGRLTQNKRNSSALITKFSSSLTWEELILEVSKSSLFNLENIDLKGTNSVGLIQAGRIIINVQNNSQVGFWEFFDVIIPEVSMLPEVIEFLPEDISSENLFEVIKSIRVVQDGRAQPIEHLIKFAGEVEEDYINFDLEHHIINVMRDNETLKWFADVSSIENETEEESFSSSTVGEKLKKIEGRITGYLETPSEVIKEVEIYLGIAKEVRLYTSVGEKPLLDYVEGNERIEHLDFTCKWGKFRLEKPAFRRGVWTASEIISPAFSASPVLASLDKMSLRDIDNYDGAVVFVLADYNVPIDFDGNITDDSRISASKETLKYLVSRGAKVIVASHLGRPKGKRVFDLTLFPIAKRLEKDFKKVHFNTNYQTVADAKDFIKNDMKKGEILLLENTRFNEAEDIVVSATSKLKAAEKSEEGLREAQEAYSEALQRNKELVDKYFDGVDIFVNDAFSVSHRVNASVVGAPKNILRVTGLLVQKELEALKKFLKGVEVVVMGGSKVSDKIKVMKNLLRSENLKFLLVGGAMRNAFLKALGVDVQNSFGANQAEVEKARKLLDDPANKGKLVLPVDVLAASRVDQSAETKVFSTDRLISGTSKIPKGWEIVDIGPRTIELYSRIIGLGESSSFANGAMGIFEIEKFSKGTEGILRAMADSSGYAGIGGGDSVAAINKFGISHDKFGHVFLAGGATLEVFENTVLPGLDALSLKPYDEAKRKIDLFLDNTEKLAQKYNTSLKEYAEALNGQQIIIYEVIRELLQTLKTGNNFFNIKIAKEAIRRIINSFAYEGKGPKPRIEVTSFTQADSFPFMRDYTEELTAYVSAEFSAKDAEFGYLVFKKDQVNKAFELHPNLDEISIVVGASDIYQRRNMGRDLDDESVTAEGSLGYKQGTINRVRELEKQYRDEEQRTNPNPVRIRFYLSNSFGYSYKDKEGKRQFDKISSGKVVRMFQQAVRMGVDELVVCDTTSEASPSEITDLIEEIKERINLDGKTLALHAHTRGVYGVAKGVAGIKAGVDVLDVSILHQGGNPLSGSNVGNLTTEDLLFVLDALGVKTNIDTEKVMTEVVPFIRKNLDSHFMRGMHSFGLDRLFVAQRKELKKYIKDKVNASSSLVVNFYDVVEKIIIEKAALIETRSLSKFYEGLQKIIDENLINIKSSLKFVTIETAERNGDIEFVKQGKLYCIKFKNEGKKKDFKNFPFILEHIESLSAQKKLSLVDLWGDFIEDPFSMGDLANVKDLYFNDIPYMQVARDAEGFYRLRSSLDGSILLYKYPTVEYSVFSKKGLSCGVAKDFVWDLTFGIKSAIDEHAQRSRKDKEEVMEKEVDISVLPKLAISLLPTGNAISRSIPYSYKTDINDFKVNFEKKFNRISGDPTKFIFDKTADPLKVSIRFPNGTEVEISFVKDSSLFNVRVLRFGKPLKLKYKNGQKLRVNADLEYKQMIKDVIFDFEQKLFLLSAKYEKVVLSEKVFRNIIEKVASKIGRKPLNIIVNPEFDKKGKLSSEQDRIAYNVFINSIKSQEALFDKGWRTVLVEFVSGRGLILEIDEHFLPFMRIADINLPSRFTSFKKKIENATKEAVFEWMKFGVDDLSEQEIIDDLNRNAGPSEHSQRKSSSILAEVKKQSASSSINKSNPKVQEQIIDGLVALMQSSKVANARLNLYTIGLAKEDDGRQHAILDAPMAKQYTGENVTAVLKEVFGFDVTLKDLYETSQILFSSGYEEALSEAKKRFEQVSSSLSLKSAREIIKSFKDPLVSILPVNHLDVLLGKVFVVKSEIINDVKKEIGKWFWKLHVKTLSVKEENGELKEGEIEIHFPSASLEFYRMTEEGFFVILSSLLEKNQSIAREFVRALARNKGSGIGRKSIVKAARDQIQKISAIISDTLITVPNIDQLAGKSVIVPELIWDGISKDEIFQDLFAIYNNKDGSAERDNFELIFKKKKEAQRSLYEFKAPIGDFMIVMSELASTVEGRQVAREILRFGLSDFVEENELGKNSSSIGGIDLTGVYEDLNIKIDISGSPLPMEFQNLNQINVEGFIPVIINIRPMPHLPVLLGFDDDLEKPAKSLARSALGPLDHSWSSDYAIR